MRHLVASWTARGVGLALGVGIVWLVATLAVEALEVLALAFVAILLAAALEPVIASVRARVPLARAWTVLLVYAVFLVAVAVFAVLVLPAAIGEGERVMTRVPAFLEQVNAWADRLQPEALGRTVRALVFAAARATTSTPETPGPDQVVQAGITLAEVLGSIATTLALVFFWLVGHARLQRYALAFVPLERRGGVRHAWDDVESRLGHWVRGQLTLMTVVGVASGTAYALLGVPSALLLGLIAGVMEAVPLIGPLLGAVPAMLFAATVSPELVAGVVAVTAVIQLVENNVLVPVVMRNSIGLSPLVVSLSLLFGAALGGILGALVAVPLVAALEVVLGRLQAREVPVAQEPSGGTLPSLEATPPTASTGPTASEHANP